jgi:hypothetical protein
MTLRRLGGERRGREAYFLYENNLYYAYFLYKVIFCMKITCITLRVNACCRVDACCRVHVYPATRVAGVAG